MKAKYLILIFLIGLTSCAGLSSTLSEPPATPTATITPTAPITYAPSPGFTAYQAIFAYDASAPLNINWLSEYSDQDAVIHTLSYQGTNRCQVDALLVTPTGDGPYPAVIYMHRGNAFKTQYLGEAIRLAGRGVVTLLPPSAFDTGCDEIDDPQYLGYIDTVLFIRRGVDLLQSLPFVDGSRLAYVGHSFGATWGGVLAGVEPRIHSFVLIAGLVDISNYVDEGMSDLDSLNYIGEAVNDEFLLQFSYHDEYISQAAADLYISFTPGEPTVLWYDSTHEGLQFDGEDDRVAWLLVQLDVE